MPRIVGTVCTLRPFAPADAAISLPWRQDPETREQAMGYPFPVSEAGEVAWYDAVAKDRSGKQAFFAIEDCADGAFVGHVRLADIDWPSRTAIFGIVVGDKNKRGKGIGREATDLILRYGFETLNLRRVELRVLASNKVAISIYESIGFVLEGRLREAYFASGNYQDVLVMGLLRSDYLAKGG